MKLKMLGILTIIVFLVFNATTTKSESSVLGVTGTNWLQVPTMTLSYVGGTSGENTDTSINAADALITNSKVQFGNISSFKKFEGRIKAKFTGTYVAGLNYRIAIDKSSITLANGTYSFPMQVSLNSAVGGTTTSVTLLSNIAPNSSAGVQSYYTYVYLYYTADLTQASASGYANGVYKSTSDVTVTLTYE